ncbi:hypothetical protein ACGF8B_25155 [Streptomyces sp. NPDC047917]|uniref:hypothetical protein n=1 Tax=Streptomyces sp. NPDC047917 TaxID=3365491 RepID=UPI003711A5AC
MEPPRHAELSMGPTAGTRAVRWLPQDVLGIEPAIESARESSAADEADTGRRVDGDPAAAPQFRAAPDRLGMHWRRR